MQHELVQIKLRCVTAVAAAARERASNSPLAEAKACIDLILGIAHSLPSPWNAFHEAGGYCHISTANSTTFPHMVILIRLEFKTDGLKVLFNSETVLGKVDNWIVAENLSKMP